MGWKTWPYGTKIIAILVVIILFFSVIMSLISIKNFSYDLNRKPTYINLKICPLKAQFVVQEYNFSKIHSCTIEKIAYGSGIVHLVRIEHEVLGPCDSVCVYKTEFGIVYEDNSVRRVNNSRNFGNPNYQIHGFIWDNLILSLKVSGIDDISTRSLVELDNVIALNYTFNKYIEGNIYLTEEGNVFGSIISTTEMTVAKAREIALEELKKENYIIKKILQVGSSTYHNCWSFKDKKGPLVPPETVCTVRVCIDGKIEVSEDCRNTNNSLLIPKSYPNVNLDYPNVGINQLMKLNYTSGNYNLKGYVTKIYTCPPCPKGAQCKICMRDNIVISEDRRLYENYISINNSLIIFIKNTKQFELGEKYQLSINITPYKSTGWPLNDIELIGYNKII